MIGFLVQGRLRIKLRTRDGITLKLVFIIGTIVAGANVVHLIIVQSIFSDFTMTSEAVLG